MQLDGIGCVLLTACAVACASGTAHDDFPGRIKKGCSSYDECVALVGEARARLLDCVRYLKGNREAMPSKYHLCSYEHHDFALAVQKAKEWQTRANTTTTTTGAMMGSPVALATEHTSAPESDPNAGLSPNAPVDRPLGVMDADRLAEMVAPYVRQARTSYPDAKRRYLAGLPPGEIFFVTTRVRDDAGRIEQVFVRVDGIAGTVISGRIASDVTLVQGHARGEQVRIEESELVDWLISKPDGSEEGNVVGKYLDSLQ